MKKDFLLITALSFLLIMIIEASHFIKEKEAKITITNTSEKQTEKKYPFGIKSEGFNIKTDTVESGEFISEIFNNNKIPANFQNEIFEKSKEYLDVKKIKIGQVFSFYYTEKDSVEKPEYIVFEKNKTDYVVVDLSDSLKVYEEQKQITIKIREAGAEINSSLWFAMQDAGLNPLLANDLSEIYAWSVDFFGIQKGDAFKIIFEEKYVDDEFIGYGKIITAYFNHYGEDIYAIPFTQDSTESYYNINGESLRKAFLKAPLKFSRIASHFSNARRHPILKIVRPHHGVDYSAPSGTPVYALGDGVILHAGYAGASGHYIKIRHNSVYTTGYLHLSSYAKGIRAGIKVKQGQLIGFVGSTGLSTGPHLDFRVWKNGKAVNPLKIEAPPVEPVKEENKEEFLKLVEKHKPMLDAIEIVSPKDSILAANLNRK